MSNQLDSNTCLCKNTKVKLPKTYFTMIVKLSNLSHNLNYVFCNILANTKQWFT